MPKCYSFQQIRTNAEFIPSASSEKSSREFSPVRFNISPVARPRRNDSESAIIINPIVKYYVKLCNLTKRELCGSTENMPIL